MQLHVCTAVDLYEQVAYFFVRSPTVFQDAGSDLQTYSCQEIFTERKIQHSSA
jgi:hypothetical protein